MGKEVEEFLEKKGWTVKRYSPFEISKEESESFAKNEAAKIVYEALRLVGCIEELNNLYKHNQIPLEDFIKRIQYHLEGWGK